MADHNQHGVNLAANFRGALYGVAIGDALGSPFEGRSVVSPQELDQHARQIGRLRYTDDTHMTIGMAESLLARQGFDGADMVGVFSDNYDREPWRGYGAGPPHVFKLVQRGTPWDQASRTLFGGSGSYGNGAAMRVAPAALFAFPDLDKVAWLARQTAYVTHAHPLGADGAVLQACAVARLMALAEDRPPADRLAVHFEEVRQYLWTDSFREILDTILAIPVDLATANVALLLGNGIEAARSVPTALYAFLRHSESFPDAVRFSICLGGDTDTIASMTGALAGCYLGEEAIPEPWKRDVEGAETLCRLADALHRGRKAHES